MQLEFVQAKTASLQQSANPGAAKVYQLWQQQVNPNCEN
jgi:uncharacterized protein YukE